LISEGKTVYEPTAEETADMKGKMQSVYAEFESTFADNLIERIRKA
jgi:TRAP-type C4-dicarboxylate transport system substrate-binding protein